jgi:hypothetical protein
MTERWRLINGAELYDIAADAGQSNDVAAANAEVLAQLRGEYEKWWGHISGRFGEQIPIVIGAEQEPETRLTAHDWHAEDDRQVPWNQEVVQKNPTSNGYWAVEISRDGTYQFELCQHDKPAGFPIDAAEASLKVGDAEAKAPVPAGATSVTLTTKLKAGKAQLQTWLTGKAGQSRGAFYVYARKVD